jgi:hypothetical protein
MNNLMNNLVNNLNNLILHLIKTFIFQIILINWIQLFTKQTKVVKMSLRVDFLNFL